MKKVKNNKGFATSFILFSLLALFLVVVSVIMFTMTNSSMLNNKIKSKILDNAQDDIDGELLGQSTKFLPGIDVNKKMKLLASSDKIRSGLLLEYNGLNKGNKIDIWEDISGNGNDGNISGAISINGGYSFDGDDYILSNQINASNITYDVTVSISDFNTQGTYHRTIMGSLQEGGCGLQVGTNSNQGNYVKGSCFIGGEYKTVYANNLIQGTTYNFSLTFDGSTLKLYKDGNLENSVSAVGNLTYPLENTVFAVGVNAVGNYPSRGYFKGNIYNVKVYNRALNAIQLTQNYNYENNIVLSNSSQNELIQAGANNIKSIYYSSDIPDDVDEENIVSTEDSIVPIYMWYEDGDIYWGSEADTVFLNENASYMFSELTLENIEDLDRINSSKTENMEKMFYELNSSSNYLTIDLSTFDLSNVTNMTEMFYGVSGNSLVVNLENEYVPSIDDFTNIFDGIYNISNLEIKMKNFDGSNITNIGKFFSGYAKNLKIDLSNSKFGNVIIDPYSSDSLLDLSTNNTNSINLNLNLSGADLSSLVSLESLFNYDQFKNLNIDMSNLNISSVENMSSMFDYSQVLGSANINLKNIIAPNVTDMSNMFYELGKKEAESVTIDMTGSNIINVEQMNDMFKDIKAKNIVINFNNLTLNNLLYADYMFSNIGYEASGNIDLNLSNLSMPNLEDCSSMFISVGERAKGHIEVDLSNFTIGSNSINSMFHGFGSNAEDYISLDISNFNAPNAQDSSYMFYEFGDNAYSSITLDLSGFDAPNITNMSYMFSDFADFNYSSTKDKIINLNLKDLDTSNVEDMSYMFSSFGNNSTGDIILDLSSFNTSNVTTMHYMFFEFGSSSSSDIVLNFANKDVRNVNDIVGMFEYFAEDSTGNITLNFNNMNFQSVTSAYDSVFKLSGSAQEVRLNMSNLNFSNYNDDTTNLFFSFGSSDNLYIDLSHMNLSSLSSADNIFSFIFDYATTLDLSYLNLSNASSLSLNVSNVNEMDLSYLNLSSASSMNLSVAGKADLSHMDISSMTSMPDITYTHDYSYYDNIINLSYLNARSVTSITKLIELNSYHEDTVVIDLNHSNFSSLTSTSNIFSNLSGIITDFELDLSYVDFSNVTDMSYMFYDLNIPEVQIKFEGINTSNLTNTSHMFDDFANNHDLTVDIIMDINNLNTSKVTDMSYMFNNFATFGTRIIVDFTNFDTSNVINMSHMFSGSSFNTLDLRSLNTSKVTDMSYMFNSCPELGAIYVSNQFTTTNVTDSTDMFLNSSWLEGYDPSHVDKEYARINTEQTPGYFSN